jgi:hypothetical protein
MIGRNLLVLLDRDGFQETRMASRNLPVMTGVWFSETRMANRNLLVMMRAMVFGFMFLKTRYMLVTQKRPYTNWFSQIHI